MVVTAVKTHKITTKDKDIFAILNRYLPDVTERSIIAITSKIVSICEGRVVPMRKISKVGKVSKVSKGEEEQKDRLIRQESQFYLSRNANKYNVSLTIARNTLVATAGIDESNGNGYYVLWPKDPQKSANAIRRHLMTGSDPVNVGVIITDSKTSPLRWGVTAFALAYSGFVPMIDYVGKPDIFGRKMEHTKMSIIDNLASAAAVVMGEGKEQTPIAVITDVPFVTFQRRNPTKKELAALSITPDDDLYGQFLKSVRWKKGKKV